MEALVMKLLEMGTLVNTLARVSFKAHLPNEIN